MVKIEKICKEDFLKTDNFQLIRILNELNKENKMILKNKKDYVLDYTDWVAYSDWGAYYDVAI